MLKKLLPEREAKLRAAIRKTQPDVAVILENISDPLNINAVLRTADACGIREIYVLDSELGLQRQEITLGKRSSGGVYKYVEVQIFHSVEACFEAVRAKTKRPIWAAHLAETYVLSHFERKPEAFKSVVEKLNLDRKSIEKPQKSLFQLDLTAPIALLFGNEHYGPTPDALEKCDGFFQIPMVGFTQSLNVSVSAAVAFYELFRQREVVGFYEKSRFSEGEENALFGQWLLRMQSKDNLQKVHF